MNAFIHCTSFRKYHKEKKAGVACDQAFFSEFGVQDKGTPDLANTAQWPRVMLAGWRLDPQLSGPDLFFFSSDGFEQYNV